MNTTGDISVAAATPRRDISTSFGSGRIALGAAAFVLLLVILVPVPHAASGALGVACPYV